MPKVGYSQKDLAPDTGFGFERGRGEIVEAVVKVHKYPKAKDAKPGDPEPQAFLCVQLGIIHLKDDLTRLDDEVKYEQISIGRKALEHFSVGQARDAKDENPTDLGQDIDTSGNCIYVRDEGSQIHPKTAWGTFVGESEMQGADKAIYKGLQKAGFKPDVLGQGFIPDLIGMKAYFGRATREKWDGYQGEKDPTAFMVKEIYVYPYEARKKAGTSAVKTTSTSATTAAAGTSEAQGGKTNGEVSADLIVHAINASRAVVADVKGQKLDLKSFRGKVQQKLLKLAVKPPTIHPKILDLLKSADTVAQVGSEAGFMVDEDGQLIWPE